MTAAAKQSNVDYAVQAKSALSAIERLTADIEAIPQKTSMCREKWRDYGAALLAQRELMPSNQKFGQWVKEHGLDSGLAEKHGVRADAMWLAGQYTIVQQLYDGTSHHPTRIRQECRDSGYEWAGETKQQKQRKSKSRRTKAKQTRYSWERVAISEGVNVRSFGWEARKQFKADIEEIDPEPELYTASGEPRLRKAIQTWLARQQPEAVSETIEEARETVNESAKERFDKAVAKARATLQGQFDAKMAELQASYEAEVTKAVESRVAPEVEAERERARKMFERNQREMRNFVARRDGIKQAMTKKQLQLVLNCLHPDRAPEGRQAKYAEAFDIVKRLQPYVDSFDGE